MEQKQWKGKWSYKPGRTPEEVEEERILESLRQSPEERFTQFIRLIRLGITLRQARTHDANKQAIV